MKRAFCFLPIIMALGLSLTYLLPHAEKPLPSAVNMQLPNQLITWQLQNTPPTSDEISTLGPGTEFSKAICYRARYGEYNSDGYAIPDRIDLSIVLSGKDMNTSIHRPERCLPAQGHLIRNSSSVQIVLADGKEITARRLHSTQYIKNPKTGEVTNELDCVTYYFFIGHDHITHDHYERTFIDMKERLLRGTEQRWAYVSASMWFGKLPWIEKPVDEKEADQKLKEFLAGFTKSQIDWEMIESRND